eukprot:TRINITY_DN47642_c0_g1_i1.p1 TRINITY_DN47642_c0_g1~~TRINITY_DN47642_c0_g1_i1.p1  ORF type:complete len:199 (-),score=31.08 TRINITY_DN47642_c0_g1_i1:169-765(-)
MPLKAAFVAAGRAVPALNRGYRTPDPSPTREAKGLQSYRIEAAWVEAEKEIQVELAGLDDSGEESTPRPTEPVEVSVGSAGHPHNCGAPCKYAVKAKGCKDGAHCDHCHLCVWKPLRRVYGSRKKRGSGRKPTAGRLEDCVAQDSPTISHDRCSSYGSSRDSIFSASTQSGTEFFEDLRGSEKRCGADSFDSTPSGAQ